MKAAAILARAEVGSKGLVEAVVSFESRGSLLRQLPRLGRLRSKHHLSLKVELGACLEPQFSRVGQEQAISAQVLVFVMEIGKKAATLCLV